MLSSFLPSTNVFLSYSAYIYGSNEVFKPYYHAPNDNVMDFTIKCWEGYERS